MIKITNYAGIDNAEQLISHITKELDIKDAEIVVTKNDSLLDKFGTMEYRVNGLLHKSAAPGVYNLMVREHPSDSMDLVLCHELVHLKQFTDGKLSLNMDSKVFTWKGRNYSGDTPYGERPWENEAFEKQWPLVRSYRRYMRDLKKSQK